MRIFALVVSTLFWSYFVLSSCVLWLGALLVFLTTSAFDRRRRLLHLYSSLWGYHYLLLLPRCRTCIEGRERIDRSRTYVLVANHQSLFDIPLLYGLFAHFKWVSKQQVFRVPFLGWNMSMNGYVPFRRGDRKSSAEVLRSCQDHLAKGSSVLLFPEGTRSLDGELGAFSPGAASMARRAGVQILPVVLDGTREILPKHGFAFDLSARHRPRVRVLEAIDPSSADPQETSEAVRRVIGAALAQMRSESAAIHGSPTPET
ncbi:MAG: 1-acyl-sn-glycerol-3-phosphate acyltransferase [Planctomycetes bacterium]|nr:1-acyl-sn-glycerol-3-phosphate acyltransferase [Planctomycetota bacterium]